MVSATIDTPSPCDVKLATYSRSSCAQSLYYPITSRKILDLPFRGTDLGLVKRELASLKYTPIDPTFGPTQSYLNFEVAIEKSDSGTLFVYFLVFFFNVKIHTYNFTVFFIVFYHLISCALIHFVNFIHMINEAFYFFKLNLTILLFLYFSQDFLHTRKTIAV